MDDEYPISAHERAIDAAVDRLAEQIVYTRRHLHEFPEPSGAEFATTLHIAGRLAEAGIPHRVPVSGRGVIADGPASHGVPRVAMRADMDGLRMQDEKAVPYRSAVQGVMHACGHDAHSAMVLGAALALWECRDLFEVPWRAIFQPAEETGVGGMEMVRAGAMDGVGGIVALHVDPERPVGQVGTRVGPLTACCRELDVTVRGRGGHAARPHQSIDPIAAAVRFASEAYHAVSRGIDCREASVLTFGAIHGGASANVIPESVTLRGTLRTLSPATADQARSVLQRVARGVSELTGATIALEIIPGPDAVINDPGVTASVVSACSSLLGLRNVEVIPPPSMGGEDFSAYLEHAPGCLFRLGIASARISPEFLHSPRFDIDESALPIGAKALARTLLRMSFQEPDRP